MEFIYSNNTTNVPYTVDAKLGMFSTNVVNGVKLYNESDTKPLKNMPALDNKYLTQKIDCSVGYFGYTRPNYDKINSHLSYIGRFLTNNNIHTPPGTFVCERGLLTKLAVGFTCPTDKNIAGQIIVESKNGVIYAVEQWYDISTFESADQYVGHKFAAHVCNKSSLHDADYHLVYAATLGQHKLVCAAEVDCIHGDKIIEIKTSKNIPIFGTLKSNKWNMQSYLAGISKILVGIKGDSKSPMTITDHKYIPVTPIKSKLTTLNLILDYIKFCVKKEHTKYTIVCAGDKLVCFEEPYSVLSNF